MATKAMKLPARRLAAFDALAHHLIARHTLTEVLSHVDSSVAAIGRALLGDALGAVEGHVGDVLAGGQTQEAGQVFATGEALIAVRLIGALFRPTEDFLACVQGKRGEGLVRHVDADVDRQPVQIGFEQLVRIYPRYGGEEGGLQLLAEGLTEGLQFAIHVVPA